MESLQSCDIEQFYQEIRSGNYKNIKAILSQRLQSENSLQFHISSAAKVALESRQLEIYELLISEEVCFIGNEDTFVITESFTNDEKRKVREIHKRRAKGTYFKHLAVLHSKSKFKHDVSDDERKNLDSVCMYKNLSNIDSIEPILKIVACAKNLDIIFDFKSFSTAHVDSTTNRQTIGICYHRGGDITIGALGLLSVNEEYLKALSVLSHELAHYAMKLIPMRTNANHIA